MEKHADVKSYRMLTIYFRLQQGGVLKKIDMAREFGVTERSIQRDLESLRIFLEKQLLPQKLVLDHQAGGYRLVDVLPKENDSE